MKRIAISALLLYSYAASAQTQGKWSLGVGATPAFDNGLTVGLYTNRHLSDHWEIGLMPYTWIYKKDGDSYDHNHHSLGLNLNARYTIIRWKVLGPYVYGYGGLGQTKYNYEGINAPSSITFNYSNFSTGIGSRIHLGSKDWSLDFNTGYFWINELDGDSKSSYLFYSIGVFKRF